MTTDEQTSNAKSEQASESDSWYKRWALIFQILTFFAISAGGYIAFKAESNTATQAREAVVHTELQRAALIETNRPQVDLGEPKPLGLVWTGSHAELRFDDDVINTGGSPALHVRLAIHSVEPPVATIRTPTDAHCALLMDDTLLRSDLGHVMKAAGVRHLEEYRVGFTASDIANAAQDRPSDASAVDPKSVGYLRFVACIAYKRTGRNAYWSARKEFVVGRRSPADRNAIMPIRVGDDLAANDLVLREDIQGNYAE